MLLQGDNQWLIARDLSVVLGTVLFVSLIVTWVILYFVRLLDIPNNRSSHQLATPKCGGVGIVTSFMIGILAAGSVLAGSLKPLGGGALLLALAMVAGVSLADDVVELSPQIRLIVQFIAATVFLGKSVLPGGESASGWFWKSMLFPLGLLWLAGLANIYNFMDGIDGLAAGQGTLVALFYALVQYLQGNYCLCMIGLILSMSCIGFLAFNFPPAKVFMGDVGSVSIGFLLAALAVLSMVEKPSLNNLLLMPLLSANFLFDSLLTLGKRALNGENLFEAHCTHLYQRFARCGFSQRTVTMCNYGLVICQGIVVLQTWDHLWLGAILIGWLQFGYWVLVCKLEERHVK